MTPVEAGAAFAIRSRSPRAQRALREEGMLAELGRVVAVSGEADAEARGLELLDAAVERDGIAAQKPRALSVWADLLLRAGRDADVRALLEEPGADLADHDRWKLRADLLNPHRNGRAAGLAGEDLTTAEEAWLEVFNEVYAPDGLEPIRLRPRAGEENPYRRLDAPADARVDGELVTVVMSAYQPDQDLLLAVRGVLRQTWHNLELLIVDDASPGDVDDLLEEVEGLDPRVRVVRAPRNGGTYAVRNLAMTIARGRWMTFQDSDDWTHPRRVEHQVRHLLDSPGVLANRTRTLRTLPDLTLTYTGYPPERLNSSALLLDLRKVLALVGEFDATRKAGDTEFPGRLEAAAPGSVEDLDHPTPLAITQLRSGSLSRSDMAPGWTRWDRLAYRDGYREWHEQIRLGRCSPRLPLPSGRRPFPLPDPSWEPDRPRGAPGGPVPPEQGPAAVVLGDFRRRGRAPHRALGVARTLATAGIRTAVAEAEAPDPPSSQKPSVLPALSADVRQGRLARTDVRVDQECALLVITDPSCVLHLDAAALRPQKILVVADEPEPAGWSVAEVEDRCEELFARPPTWGGPAQVHYDRKGTSTVRLDVADERWGAADLAVVAGDGWHRVPARRRALGPAVVIGHHVEAPGRRWPKRLGPLEAAHPEEVSLRSEGDERVLPVEVHALHSMKGPEEHLEGLPSSWVPLAGSGMSEREFLAHIDVWVYFGVWDTAAQVAALEALGAGLPCVLGAAAATSGLEGPVRCVPPAEARAAIEELLASSDHGEHASTRRQRDWELAVERLMTGSGVAAGASMPPGGID